MTPDQSFTFMTWGFGICAMGFFFLAGLLWRVFALIRSSEHDVGIELKRISGSVAEMTTALVGTIKEKGFISKHYDLEKRVQIMERHCGKNHGST